MPNELQTSTNHQEIGHLRRILVVLCQVERHMRRRSRQNHQRIRHSRRILVESGREPPRMREKWFRSHAWHSRRKSASWKTQRAVWQCARLPNHQVTHPLGKNLVVRGAPLH
jgi:hypothetical protein